MCVIEQKFSYKTQSNASIGMYVLQKHLKMYNDY